MGMDHSIIEEYSATFPFGVHGQVRVRHPREEIERAEGEFVSPLAGMVAPWREARLRLVDSSQRGNRLLGMRYDDDLFHLCTSPP